MEFFKQKADEVPAASVIVEHEQVPQEHAHSFIRGGVGNNGGPVRICGCGYEEDATTEHVATSVAADAVEDADQS